MGSQAIAKGIGSACPLPSLPLTSVLSIPDFSFNIISISKITRNLHCLLTFSYENVGQNQSTKDPLQMSIGSITRAMVKKLQEALNRLVNEFIWANSTF